MRFRQGKNKLYFASDLHLGVPDPVQSKEKEKRFIRWMSQIKADAAALFIVGDLFDFWFEYTYTAPKGYTRLIAKLAEFQDEGIPVYLFLGNHDMWMRSYLEEEAGVQIIKDPIRFRFGGKYFEVGHGDGLGPGDHGYKLLKKIFRSPVNQWLFARLHPNLAFGLASFWSKKSRLANHDSPVFLGDKEFLYQYCLEAVKEDPCDYYLFGHRHLAVDVKIGDTESRYINLGEWFNACTYAVFEGDIQLHHFRD